MPDRPAISVPTSLRALIGTYLSRQEGARYEWRVGIAAMLAVGVPAIGGVALGEPAAGITVALGSWLMMRSNPRGDTRTRVTSLLRRCLLMTAGLGLGGLLGGWAALPLVALAAVGPFPALTLVVGSQHSAATLWVQTLLFLAGGLFACVLLLLPVFGGRHAPPQPRAPRRALRRRLADAVRDLRTAAREGTPRFRHAVRLAVCLTAAYAVLTATHLPGGQLVVVGIVTTLRPTWGQTTSRIVKRVGGTILGCVIAAGLLVVAAGLSPYLLMAAVALLSGLGRPFRQINYGFWPVFSAPVTLLLTDVDGTITWVDALERSTYNAAGAVLAAVAALVLWPSHEEDRIPDRLADVVGAHARLVRRAATLIAEPGNARGRERENTREAAKSAAEELGAARRRFSRQRHTERGLLTDLDAVGTTAAALRNAVQEAVATGTPAACHLDAVAGDLELAADHLTQDLPPRIGRPAHPDGSVVFLAGELVRQADRAAATALGLSRRRRPADATPPTTTRS